MRILQIGLSYNPGGIESCIMSYYRELKKAGVQYDFISMYPHLAYEDEIKALGGKIFYVSNIKKNPVRFRKELGGIIRREGYQIVHVNMLSAANIVPLLVSQREGVKKVIAHSHNSSTPGIHRKILHKINKSYIQKYATDFFACSHAAAKWLFTKDILQEVGCQIVKNAIQLPQYLYNEAESRNIRSSLGIEDKLVFGHVGRFEEQKNHEFLLDIFREIAVREENAVLLLIGDGQLKSKMERKANESGIGDRVIFLGVRKEVSQLWKAIDVLLFPSLFEGLPVVPVEAQASGAYAAVADTISREVKITDNIDFLPLDKGAVYWAEVVLRKYKKQRADNHKIIEDFQKSGYDIEEAAIELTKLYVGQEDK